MTNNLNLPVPAYSLVPHKGSMLMIDELSEYSSNSYSTVRYKILPGNLFLEPCGRLGSVCLVELLAQAAAAVEGFEAKNENRPIKNGYLAGINNFSIDMDAYKDNVIVMCARKTVEMNGITVIEGTVETGCKTLATGSIKFFITDTKSPSSETTYLSTPSAVYDKYKEPANGRSIIVNAIIDSILKKSSHKEVVSGEFCFDNDFPGFSGHFPGMSVLPAVVMIDMALILGETLTGTCLKIISIDRAKFLRVVLPKDKIYVTVELKSNEDKYRLSAKLNVGKEKAATISFSAVRKRQI